MVLKPNKTFVPVENLNCWCWNECNIFERASRSGIAPGSLEVCNETSISEVGYYSLSKRLVNMRKTRQTTLRRTSSVSMLMATPTLRTARNAECVDEVLALGGGSVSAPRLEGWGNVLGRSLSQPSPRLPTQTLPVQLYHLLFAARVHLTISYSVATRRSVKTRNGYK